MDNQPSEALSRSEKDQIQYNYAEILANLKEEELLMELFSVGYVSAVEKLDLKSKTPVQVRHYIVNKFFLKATYSQVKAIHGILKTSPTPSHVELAKLLPIREEDAVDWVACSSPAIRPEQPAVDPLEDHTDFPSVQERNYINNLNTTYCEGEGNAEYQGANISQARPLSRSKTLSRRITVPLRNAFRKVKGLRNSTSSPAISSAPPLSYYGVKDNNDPVYGNSICFVIANFTDDLRGYNKDAADIVDFHKKQLRCNNVYAGKWGNLSLRDLTKEEFMQVLRMIQKSLKKAHNVDRFFLYILSHGDEHGIKMCKKGSRRTEQGTDDNGEPIRVQMQDIVDMFSHDQVPALKTFPKVFINQSCQGEEILQAAGLPSFDDVDGSKSSVQLWKPPQFKLAVGADVLICDATSHNSMSWVSSNGSVFIQNLLQVMGAYLYTEDFYHILVEVNNRISLKVMKGNNPTTNETVLAAQMPRIHSQLTRKFFLACPREKPKD